MLQSVKDNRKRLLSEIQLDKQRLDQAPTIPGGKRSLILHHLADLEAQLARCNAILCNL